MVAAGLWPMLHWAEVCLITPQSPRATASLKACKLASIMRLTLCHGVEGPGSPYVACMDVYFHVILQAIYV